MIEETPLQVFLKGVFLGAVIGSGVAYLVFA